MGPPTPQQPPFTCSLISKCPSTAQPPSGLVSESRESAGCLAQFLLESISKSFEEDNEAGKLDKAEKIVGVVLPANEDPALPLNPGEEALDEPASHVAA